MAVSAQDFAAASAAALQLRLSIEEALAAPGEIVVPKATSDEVATLLSWLNEEETQSLDLVGELVRLGPRALPVCLRLGYKVDFDSRTGDELVKGLLQLAREDTSLAEQSIDQYALSSNLAIRNLCRRLSEELGSLPVCYLDALTNDAGVLFPSERLEIAELCLRLGRDSGAMLALSKYLCREYLIGPNQYHLLARRVASRMGTMPYADKALLIVEDTTGHIWEELDEFDRARPEQRRELEEGLLELMAEAFASMGDEGLALFRAGKVPRHSSGDLPLPLFRRFGLKLAARFVPAREWFLGQAKEHPSDGLFWNIAEKLRATPVAVELDELRRTVDAFVAHGEADDLNTLRFSSDIRIFRLLDDVMSPRPDTTKVKRVLALLKGFQSRQRYAVVPFVLRHWATLGRHNYELSTSLLTTHGVPDKFKDFATNQLSDDLRGATEPFARDALERILS